jgi:hypothetical protein
MATKFLDWSLWDKVNSGIPKSTGKNGRSMRHGERFHLYSLHQVYLHKLIQAVADQCRRRSGIPVAVRASSYWIDCRPRANWTSSSGALKTAELGDLLVDVHVSYQGQPAFRRAVVVQGKWTQSCEQLDIGSCEEGAPDPSNRERDLLETHIGPVTLEMANAKRGTSDITFEVTKDKVYKTLMGHARYLLFLDAVGAPAPPAPDPYLCLVPKGRKSAGGACRAYEDMLCDLAQATRLPGVPPTIDKTPEWLKAVEAIHDWADGKHRGGRIFGATTFPHERHSVGTAFLMAVSDDSVPPVFTYCFSRDDDNWFIGPPRSTGTEQFDRPTFQVLSVSVDYAHPLPDAG